MSAPVIIRVIDFETTGMEPPAEVVEVGTCDLTQGEDGWEVGKPNSWLCRVAAIPPEVRAVHHITLAEANDGFNRHPFDAAEIAQHAHGRGPGETNRARIAHALALSIFSTASAKRTMVSIFLCVQSRLAKDWMVDMGTPDLRCSSDFPPRIEEMARSRSRVVAKSVMPERWLEMRIGASEFSRK